MAFRNLLRISKPMLPQYSINRTISVMPFNYSRFRSSEKFKSVDQHPEVEVIKNPPEWRYVEHLLGQQLVPLPETKSEYPSGWLPPNPEKFKNLPYYVKRTRNYMVPVFLKIHYRGSRRRTFIKNIEGDIWKLEQDLVGEIKKRIGNNPVFSQINEMNRTITFKGDYVTLVQKYFYQVGL